MQTYRTYQLVRITVPRFNVDSGAQMVKCAILLPFWRYGRISTAYDRLNQNRLMFILMLSKCLEGFLLGLSDALQI